MYAIGKRVPGCLKKRRARRALHRRLEEASQRDSPLPRSPRRKAPVPLEEPEGLLLVSLGDEDDSVQVKDATLSLREGSGSIGKAAAGGLSAGASGSVTRAPVSARPKLARTPPLGSP